MQARNKRLARHVFRNVTAACMFAIIFAIEHQFRPDSNPYTLGAFLIAVGIASETFAEARGYSVWSHWYALACVTVAAALWFTFLTFLP